MTNQLKNYILQRFIKFKMSPEVVLILLWLLWKCMCTKLHATAVLNDLKKLIVIAVIFMNCRENAEHLFNGQHSNI